MHIIEEHANCETAAPGAFLGGVQNGEVKLLSRIGIAQLLIVSLVILGVPELRTGMY
jgi:hypothetical protein